MDGTKESFQLFNCKILCLCICYRLSRGHRSSSAYFSLGPRDGKSKNNFFDHGKQFHFSPPSEIKVMNIM